MAINDNFIDKYEDKINTAEDNIDLAFMIACRSFIFSDVEFISTGKNDKNNFGLVTIDNQKREELEPSSILKNFFPCCMSKNSSTNIHRR